MGKTTLLWGVWWRVLWGVAFIFVFFRPDKLSQKFSAVMLEECTSVYCVGYVKPI
ncbi:hypothetical protein [Microcystis aeruginosa]|uniref:hypothetical protein n=1 Tax=Microcystis aeruginosa TaxID=1126 RepID=UPI0012BAE792|nr:hypothetical protein [Microcystis aeruginosa]